MKIMHVVGARPNFMKIAPIMREMAKFPGVFDQVLVHTGQHYDKNMSAVFFSDLSLEQADINLNVGPGSHAEQTARVMQAIEPVLLAYRPDWLIVVGDVNSTLAAALVGAKLGTKVAHVEAGLRSFDRGMPEEINRIVTDQLADLLFTTELSANNNLNREGIPQDRTHFVGNVMIDSLMRILPKTDVRRVPVQSTIRSDRYVVVTFHRASTTDIPGHLSEVLLALSDIAQEVDVVFPMHPRTRKQVEKYGLTDKDTALHVTEPLGYLDFLTLMRGASVVVTDSGGIQDETTFLGIPCLTVRPNTERPITVTQGTNRLIECHRGSIVQAVQQSLQASAAMPSGSVPDLWDGHAAERIVEVFHRLAEASI